MKIRLQLISKLIILLTSFFVIKLARISMEASFKQVEHKIIIRSRYIKNHFKKNYNITCDILLIDDFAKNFNMTIIFKTKRS